MDKTVTIAVSLPQEVLEAAEREREARGETRSQFFRRAIESLLRQDGDDADDADNAVDRYVRGYREQPETDEEIAVVHHIGASTIAQEPWE